jgi:hypothetical protein
MSCARNLWEVAGILSCLNMSLTDYSNPSVATRVGGRITFQQLGDNRELRMPGAWVATMVDSEALDISVVLSSLAYATLPTLKSGSKRALALLSVVVLTLWAVAIALILVSVAPLLGVFIVWAVLGPAGTVSLLAFVLAFLLGAAAMIKAFIWRYWVVSISWGIEVLLDAAPGVVDSAKEWALKLAKLHGQLVASGDVRGLEELSPFALPFDRDIMSTASHTEIARSIAVYSAVLYGPDATWKWRHTLAVMLIFMSLLIRKLSTTVLRGVKLSWFFIRWGFVLASLSLVVDPDVILGPIWALVSLVFYFGSFVLSLFRSKGFKEAKALARLYFLYLVVRCLALWATAGLLVRRHRGKGQSFNRSLKSFRAIANHTMMDIGKFIDDIALPDFIRTVRDRVDGAAIQESLEIMATLGWPKPVSLTEPDMEKVLPSYKEHVIAGFNFKAGIRNARLRLEPELQSLREIAPQYMRATQYATWQNELETTARYFTSYDVNYPDLGVDEAWELLSPIFKDSRLTPFNVVVRHWEKRYGLGPFWEDPDKPRRKLPRWKAIRLMGGMVEFTKAWARTFYWAPRLVPISGVSVKDEALPPKKWMADKVRTILSAPLSHYIMSTVFNYQSNHNFQYWTTPIKVGMPLNGANLALLAEQHMDYQNHFAGDFTAFDSTVKGRVLSLVKEVRKRGFTAHRDYAKICHLIDVNYEQLYSGQPLAFTSTGNIFDKKTGLSTGHSATSMDNSVALVVLYLMMWKDVTGLSASQFRHFNKLSCYGDDHVLSWLNTAPSSWRPDNMIKACKAWGLELRNEAPDANGLEGIEFLAKFWRKPTATEVKELRDAHLPVPAMVVYHNKSKLIGKATAPVKNFSIDYRLVRIISYLDLTAHHHDVYLELARHARVLNAQATTKRFIPSYTDVLKKWYNPKSVFKAELDAPPEADTDDRDVVLVYGNTSLLDQVLASLAVLPDLLNPVIYNQGFTDWLISRLGERMSWPWHFLSDANGCQTIAHVQAIGRKTPYEWLVANPHIWHHTSSAAYGSLLMRHWLYMAFKWPDSMTPLMVKQMRLFTRKMSDAQFLLNGRVWVDTYRAGAPLWDMALVFALSFMPETPWLGPLKVIQLPNPLVVTEYVYQAVLAKVWNAVPPNFKELTHQLRLLQRGQPLLVEAPTGSGKSTALVAFIANKLADQWKYIVVVSPRAMVAETTAPYMRATYGVDTLAVTGTEPFARRAKVLYVTPAEVYLHGHMIDDDTLVMVDECHLAEPLTASVCSYVRKMAMWSVWMSATPSQANIESAGRFVPLRMASVWKKEEIMSATLKPTSQTGFFKAYFESVATIVATSSSWTRFLIFVPSLHHVEQLEALISAPCCGITSQSKFVDPQARIFIATSVADVGLTLPGVDWVITSNVTRGLVMSNGTEVLQFLAAEPSLLKQRAGRTGRTNNGVYTIFSAKPGCDWIHESGKEDEIAYGWSLLKAGVPFANLAIITPGFISHVLGIDRASRDNEPLLDSFVKLGQHWQDAERQLGMWTHLSAMRTPSSAFYGDDYKDLADGTPSVVLHESVPVWKSQAPVTTKEWYENMTRICAWFAVHGLEFTAKSVKTMFLEQPITATSLVGDALVGHPELENDVWAAMDELNEKEMGLNNGFYVRNPDPFVGGAISSDAFNEKYD